MGIGGGIALLVIGAILSFGVSDRLEGIDLTVIGYICMGAGALALILVTAFNSQRTNTTHRQVVEHHEDPAVAPQAAAPAAPQAAPQAAPPTVPPTA